MKINNPPLIVPQGIVQSDLKQLGIQQVDNGAVLTKLYLVNEAGRAPYQVQSVLIFASMKEALEAQLSELS